MRGFRKEGLRAFAVWLLATLSLTRSSLSQQARGTAPLDTIVARCIAARGGLDRLKAVRTERLVGRITFPNGASGVDTIELARPLRVRTTIHLGPATLIQAYDGHTAWGVNPFQGDSTPHVLDAGTAKNVIAGADMEGPLVDYRSKGNRVALAGLDTADGRPAYALRVIRRDSTEDTYFVDTASFLLVKWQGHRTPGGRPVTFQTYFRDYRIVDGLRLPFQLESGALGQPGAVHIVLDTIAIDVSIRDDRFVMP